MSDHQPVLLSEALDYLAIQPAGVYVDGTFGRGGHSQAILARLGPSGRLIALDQDPDAVQYGKALIVDARFQLYHANFAELTTIMNHLRLLGQVDGILFDLGVSSPQLDQAERGFSFSKPGPLDMRMNPSEGMSAAQWLAQAETAEITQVLRDYGEERFARRIATAIVAARAQHPITTTIQLATLIEQSVPKRPYRQKSTKKTIHPATRSFQAMRIFINDELDQLQRALQQSLDCLAPNGRLVVISFHSLEDRIVKRFMLKAAQGESYPKDLPIKAANIKAKMRLIARKVRASSAEINTNPRARSAVLRAAEKIG